MARKAFLPEEEEYKEKENIRISVGKKEANKQVNPQR